MRSKAKKPGKPACNASVAPVDSHHDDQSTSALVTTSQAARIAGVSPSTIVRNRGELGAVPGPNGYLFNEQIVRQKITTIRQRQSVVALGPTSGEVASAVFAALKEGKHPTDIVIDLRISPDVVVALKASYDQMHSPPTGAGARWAKCRCGSGRAACWCMDCAIPLDSPSIQRRVIDGAEELRLVGTVTWGRLPEKRADGWSDLAVLELHGEWVSADSEPGRELLAARHASRVDEQRTPRPR
jgi:hypothetical protein